MLLAAPLAAAPAVAPEPMAAEAAPVETGQVAHDAVDAASGGTALPAAPAANKSMDAHVDESLLTPVQRLFVAIQQDRPSTTVGDLLRGAFEERGVECQALMDYQVLGNDTSGRTLKVKCSERPVLLVKLDADGGWQLTGGDGTIAPMRIADGRIVTLMGVDVNEYLAHSANADTDPDAVVQDLPVKPDIEAGGALVPWMALGVSLLVLASLGYLFWLEWSWRRAHGARWMHLSSDEKDRLIEESREVYPDIFQHPDGVFITRGSRGKRRLFHSMTAAYIYRSTGIKIAELR